MRRLRILVVSLILWLLFFFSIERFIAPINISRVAYPFAPLMALLILLLPGLRRFSIWLLLIIPIPVFLLLKALAGYQVFGSALPLTVTEICAISLTTILARSISDGLNEFEQAIAHITIGQMDETAYKNLHGQAEMYQEVRRARQHERPLSLLAIEIEQQSIEVALDRIVREAQHTLMKRYVISDIARVLCDELEDYNLITQENNHFLVMLPEITPEKVSELVIRLQNLVNQQVGVKLIIGAASFPGDAVTFESLMEKARKEALNKLKAENPSTYQPSVAQEGTTT
jgi:hypothetical protein